MDLKNLAPTKKTEYILLTIFVLILIKGFFDFPFSSLFSSGADIENISFLKLGWPFVFFEISLSAANDFPIHFLGFFIDLLLYLVFSYLVDVGLTQTVNSFKKQQKTDAVEDSSLKEEIMERAVEAFRYYVKQGKSEDEIVKMFKEKSWTDVHIKELLERIHK